MNSILASIKKLSGEGVLYNAFDYDIIVAVNTCFMILEQLGVGPDEGFSIEDDSKTWNDYFLDKPPIEAVKSFIALKVRLLFDPPQTGPMIEAMERQVKECEWRINSKVDY